MPSPASRSHKPRRRASLLAHHRQAHCSAEPSSLLAVAGLNVESAVEERLHIRLRQRRELRRVELELNGVARVRALWQRPSYSLRCAEGSSSLLRPRVGKWVAHAWTHATNYFASTVADVFLVGKSATICRLIAIASSIKVEELSAITLSTG